MKPLLCCMVVLGAVLAAVNVAAAEEAMVDSTEMWLLAKYDMNGDQVISMSEITNKRDKMFGYMDDDADGIVSFDEYQGLDVRRRQQLLKARFNKLDIDHDNQLSADEYRSYLGSFGAIDSNGDGRITQNEILPPTEVNAPVAATPATRCLLWVCVRTQLN